MFPVERPESQLVLQAGAIQIPLFVDFGEELLSLALIRGAVEASWRRATAASAGHSLRRSVSGAGRGGSGARRFGRLGRQPEAARGRPDEIAEERMRPVRPALELWMRLGCHEPWMVAQLDVLDQPAVRRDAAEP